MKKLLAIILFFYGNYVLGQDIVDTIIPKTDTIGRLYTLVEERPRFPGGDTAMFKFLRENIKYPAKARRKGIMGKVFIAFIVENTGKVTDIKLLRGVSKEIDEEALRVIKLMPDWIPGKQNGRAVNVQQTLPINFTLT